MLALSACGSSTGAIKNKLDPLTAVTITYSQVPMVFYRDNSGAAAFARNFVHLGPLEVNQTGSFRYYLWLGIWNTMQHSDSGEPRQGFESIVVYADGEPLQLELAGWTAEAIGASEPVYLKPVSSAADAYYEVSVDHIRLIATAKRVRIQSTGPQRRSYELWNHQELAKASLAEFVRSSVY
jgi:hypothetical protein